jgi:hypothetical protein
LENIRESDYDQQEKQDMYRLEVEKVIVGLQKNL